MDESKQMQAGSPCGCYAINVAQPVNFCPKHAAVDALIETLKAALPTCDFVTVRDTGGKCDVLAPWVGSFGFRYCEQHHKLRVENGRGEGQYDELAAQGIAALSLAGKES